MTADEDGKWKELKVPAPDNEPLTNALITLGLVRSENTVKLWMAAKHHYGAVSLDLTEEEQAVVKALMAIRQQNRRKALQEVRELVRTNLMQSPNLQPQRYEAGEDMLNVLRELEGGKE